MKKPTKKQTSDRVSSIAARVMGGDFMTPDVQNAVQAAVKDCGLPMNDRASLVLVNRIETALAPLFDDFKTLAASCLSQDETPAEPKVEGFTVPLVEVA
jgi:hypothetical protein